jgi:glycerophosphoryl diester phosphodiesterase
MNATVGRDDERRLGSRSCNDPAMAVITFAHRGGRADLPDNTLPAFRRALELGARGLETDARLSADGEVVLAHDEKVRRGVRRLSVPDTDAAALAEAAVPRLADLYAECGTGYELSVDCKVKAAARPMIEVARAAGPDAPGRLWLCTPSLTLLADLREWAPDVKLVFSPGRSRVAPAAMERHAADLAGQGVDCLNLHHSEWTRGLVALFHRFGLEAFAWDTQETRYILAALRYGIDGIYCDRVDRMVATVGEWTSTEGDATDPV